MITLRKYLSITLLLWFTSGLAMAQASRASSAASYVDRGNSWMAKGEIERAIADYDLAITFDSRSASAWHNRGVARYRRGDLAGALDDLNHAVEADPQDLQVLLSRGAINTELGNLEAAIH